MKINCFSYFDRVLEWRLEPVEFEDLTLLIGASGVGKTLILKAILDVKAIAGGASRRGIEWKIDFETVSSLKYTWQGAFENQENSPEGNAPSILYENVWLNGSHIVERSKDGIIFNGGKTPRLSQQESIIKILKEEERIEPAYQAFKKILHTDYPESLTRGVIADTIEAVKLRKEYRDLESIRNSCEDTGIKLFLIHERAPDIFNKIKEALMSIFPQIEDVVIGPLQLERDMPQFARERFYIQIKEKGVKEWIPQFRISSGMFRTLMHIAELYLVPAGTLILIDEFENSLGINCIDELTDLLMASGRELRFIVTSHHPYIINNIGFKHWKLITRKAGVVKALAPDALSLGKSKHDAFIQLINLDEYKNGIALEEQ
jgi:predicted ATPase